MTIQLHPQVVSGKEVQSAPDCFAITKSDSDNFAYQVRAIYVGGAGTVQVVTPSGAVVPFVCAAGAILPVRAIRVNSTSTDATGMVGLY